MDTYLEPVWNGAMERSGEAPGLSAYQGHSSIYHSANFERMDALEHGECMGSRPRVPRGKDKKPRMKPGRYDKARVLEMLRSGVSYSQIGRALGCSISVARNVARKNGIARQHLIGCNQFANAAREWMRS